MDLGLAGRRALVLASSQGLGAAIALRLAKEGASVAITGRSEERLASTAKWIEAETGIKPTVMVADLTDACATASICDAAMADANVDILVNNTGGPPPGLASTVSQADWLAQFNQMVLPLFEITRRLLPGMRERHWGRVLTITSSGIVQPIPNLPISNTLRSSIVGWSKSLATEVAADGVTVNIIAPGRIATNRTRQIDAAAAAKSGKSAETVRAESCATIPMGRYGTAEEFAAVAAFLASEPASYVTGSIIRVDGGLIRSV